jgi:hypothetical protein
MINSTIYDGTMLSFYLLSIVLTNKNYNNIFYWLTSERRKAMINKFYRLSAIMMIVIYSIMINDNY